MHNNYNRKHFHERRYRSEIDIIHDILLAFKKTLGKGMGKTRIMYSANLNTHMLSIYLDKLTKHGLLVEKEVNGKKIYNITSKGMLALFFISKLNMLLRTHDFMDSTKDLKKKIILLLKEKTKSPVVYQDYTTPGESGILHQFDVLFKTNNGKKVAVHISVSEDDTTQPLEYLWFLLGLIDTKIDVGVYIRTGGYLNIEQKEYLQTKIYKLTIPKDNEVDIMRFLHQIIKGDKQFF